MCEQLVTSSYPYPNFFILENYLKKGHGDRIAFKMAIEVKKFIEFLGQPFSRQQML